MEDVQNSVTPDPQGFVVVKLVGAQDYLTMEKVGKACSKYADDMRAQGKPVLGLIDFTDDKVISSGTNKAVLEALEHTEYDKAALFGSNPVVAVAAKAVVAALGKSESTKVFDSREAAMAWLLTKDPLRGY